MNKKVLVGFGVYGALMYGLNVGFVKAEKAVTRVPSIQAVAVEKKKGRAEENSIDKQSYMLRKLTPEEGEAREPGRDPLSNLAFDIRDRRNDGANSHSRLLNLIESASRAAAKEFGRPDVDVIPQTRPEDLQRLKVSVVTDKGAVINGRYRDIGEQFVAGATKASIVTAEPTEGKVQVAGGEGMSVWLTTRGPLN